MRWRKGLLFVNIIRLYSRLLLLVSPRVISNAGKMPTTTTLYPETENLTNMAQSASPSRESIAPYSYSTAEVRDNSSRQQCFGMVNLEFFFISSEESKIDAHVSNPGKAAKF